MKMKNAVIVACGRSAFGRIRGKLSHTRPESICAQVVQGVLGKVPKHVTGEIEDFILGCAYPEAQQGANMAKNVVGLAGLPDDIAGQTINRFCSSGLQSIATAANTIMTGQQKVVLAGGVESMSAVPMGGVRYLPDPDLLAAYPDYYITMGLTAENVAEKYGITRDQMDEFAVGSHKKAYAAQLEGKSKDEIIPIKAIAGDDGSGERKQFTFDTDEGIRPGTTMESLGRLRTVFKKNGVVTAGNSSQMTDGAAVVLLMEEEYALSLGLKPIARFVTFAVSGVEPGLMGIGPIKAIPKALALAGMKKEDMDLIELNEAFAAQSLACINTLELDMEKINVNGGAIALGHPLGCTGSALTVKLLHELERRNGRFGMVTMCIGGGQGAAGIFERL